MAAETPKGTIWTAIRHKSRHKAWLILVLLTTQAQAYDLTLGDHIQPIRERPYHVSADCGTIAADVDRAIAIWNFYAPARFVKLDTLPAREQRFMSVICQDGQFFEDSLNLARTFDGVTYWRYTNTDFQMRSADIVFNASAYVPQHCSRLHEIGHALGLGHSKDPRAAMWSDSDCEYLAADDLLGIAAVFGVAPNCTPYVSERFTVYFPAINGEWLELRPLVAGNPAAGFYESGRGKALAGNWQCDLVSSGDGIEGRFYYRGSTLRVKLARSGNGWGVVSAK